MARNKTTEQAGSVSDFIHSYVANEQKRKDSFRLIDLMADWSGFEPKLWGTTLIGFGQYHYRYASGREGDAPLIGFSPRKAALSLYIYSPVEEQKRLLDNLGQFKMGKACIYIKKLADINLKVVEELCRATIAYVNEHHECACRA